MKIQLFVLIILLPVMFLIALYTPEIEFCTKDIAPVARSPTAYAPLPLAKDFNGL